MSSFSPCSMIRGAFLEFTNTSALGMFGAAQLPVNHNTEDRNITVAPFFFDKLAVLMDKKSESFTNGIMVQID